MASRTPMAIKTKKTRKLQLEEMLYISGRGMSADYESGRIPWPDHVLEARKKSVNYRNCRAGKLLTELGII